MSAPPPTQVLLLVVDRSPIEHLLSSALSAHRYSLIEHVLQLCPPVDAALDAFLVSWTASRSLHAVIDISRRFKRHSAVGQIFLYQVTSCEPFPKELLLLLLLTSSRRGAGCERSRLAIRRRSTSASKRSAKRTRVSTPATMAQGSGPA